jgi:uncharacterized repeat protein (TIGR01451 family)
MMPHAFPRQQMPCALPLAVSSSGETHRVAVRLKITNAALFNAVNFGGHNGDFTQGVKASNDNPWRYWGGGIVTFSTIPTLLPGKGGVVEFNVATNATAGQVVSNTGCVNSAQLPTLQTSVATVNVDAIMPLTVTKSSAVYYYPVNGTTDPKAIPGALISYTIAVGNPSPLITDPNSVVVSDQTPANLAFHVADIASAGSGPALLNDGAPTFSLTYSFTSFSFTSFSSTNDDVDFSNANGATWSYRTVLDIDGDDLSVTNFRIRPKGTMAIASNFALNVRYRLK